MTTSDSNPQRPAPRLGSAVLLVAVGALLATIFTNAGRESAPVFPDALFSNSLYADENPAVGAVEGAEYTYFTFRRNLWAVHRASGKVQFLVFPDGQEQQLQRSVTHQIDQEIFPPDQVQFQLSERNLTNFLWIMNPVTGKARYIRAGRDASIEVSEIESVSKLGQ